MRNCDARLTGEVHKRFYEQRRNWSVLPKPHLVIAAVAVCVAMYLGTAPTLRAVPQQNASGSNLDRVSRASVITAKPEPVTLSDGRLALQSEEQVHRQQKDPTEKFFGDDEVTEEEAEFLRGRKSWNGHWTGQRVELNALTIGTIDFTLDETYQSKTIHRQMRLEIRATAVPRGR
jgi:hypothetical protein